MIASNILKDAEAIATKKARCQSSLVDVTSEVIFNLINLLLTQSCHGRKV